MSRQVLSDLTFLSKNHSTSVLFVLFPSSNDVISNADELTESQQHEREQNIHPIIEKIQGRLQDMGEWWGASKQVLCFFHF